jgi:flavin-dependent dehydrogenase
MARVLSDYVDEVLVFERKPYVEGNSYCSQGKQLHNVLQPVALDQLEDLFPGFTSTLAEYGNGPIASECVLYNGRLGVNQALALDRAIIDRILHERIIENPKVALQNQARVTGLLTENRAGRVRVTGVTVDSNDGVRDFRADAVFDCSGRAASSAKWLADIGVQPDEMRVDPKLHLKSCLFRRPNVEQAPAWHSVVEHRGFPAVYIHPLDDETWLCTIGSFGDLIDISDRSMDSFIQLLEKLLPPGVCEVIRAAEPIGLVFGWATGDNRFRKQFVSARIPDGIAAGGDTVCATNPYHSLGMRFAVWSAVILRDVLKDSDSLDSALPIYRRSLNEYLEPWWRRCAYTDLRLHRADGHRPLRYYGFLFFTGICLPLACWSRGIRARRDYLNPQAGVPDLFQPGSVLRTIVTATLAPVGWPLRLGWSALRALGRGFDGKGLYGTGNRV